MREEGEGDKGRRVQKEGQRGGEGEGKVREVREVREEGSKGEGDTTNNVFYILHNEHYITVGSYTISSSPFVAIRKHKITLLFDEVSEHHLESQEFNPDTWLS